MREGLSDERLGLRHLARILGCAWRQVNETEVVRFRTTANVTRNETSECKRLNCGVYHFSPLCNHTPPRIDGVLRIEGNLLHPPRRSAAREVGIRTTFQNSRTPFACTRTAEPEKRWLFAP